MESFLERFPEGDYVFAGTTLDGRRLRSTAQLTHDLPAHPKVRVKFDDDEVNLTWRPVTDCFDAVPCDSVDVVEYSVKIEEEDVEREDFVDGGFTNGTARYQEAHYLPDAVCNRRRCKVTMTTDFLSQAIRTPGSSSPSKRPATRPIRTTRSSSMAKSGATTIEMIGAAAPPGSTPADVCGQGARS